MLHITPDLIGLSNLSLNLIDLPYVVAVHHLLTWPFFHVAIDPSVTCNTNDEDKELVGNMRTQKGITRSWLFSFEYMNRWNHFFI